MIKTYQKGIRFERELVNNARKEGKIAGRFAGSKTGSKLPLDVCVIDLELKIITFTQAKSGKHPQKHLNHLRTLLQQHDSTYSVKFELQEK